MKTEFRKAINAIISKDDKTAKAIIREAIQTDARYLDYKQSLSKHGMNLKKVDVPEQTYDDIQEILQDFPKEVRLKILDETWKLIKNENL